MIKNEDNKIVVTAYPVSNYEHAPDWTQKADGWGVSVSFLDMSGMSSTQYGTKFSALRGGINHLQRLMRVQGLELDMDKVIRQVRYIEGGFIYTKVMGGGTTQECKMVDSNA